MQVKSAIARPMRGERIAPTTPYRVFGAAWSDGADIVKVEVSSDSGQTWKEAKLLGDAAPYMCGDSGSSNGSRRGLPASVR